MSPEPVPVEVLATDSGVWAIVKNNASSYEVRPVQLGEPLPTDFRFKYLAVRWIVAQETANGRLD